MPPGFCELVPGEVVLVGGQPFFSKNGDKGKMEEKTKEELQEKLRETIDDFLNECRAAGVQFACAFLFEEVEGGRHNVETSIHAFDDHHFLDMQCGLHEGWWKANHK